MSKYVNAADAAKKIAEKHGIRIADLCYTFGDIPAADVAEVRHGRWVFGKDLACCWGQILKNKYHLYCSECLEQAFNRSEDNDPDFDIDTPYCPTCGAYMMGENNGKCE